MDNSTIWKIINTYFEDNPQSLVRHHIDSYNDFFKNGIFQIFKEKNPLRINTRFDKEIDDYRSQCIMYFGGKNGDKIYFVIPNSVKTEKIDIKLYTDNNLVVSNEIGAGPLYYWSFDPGNIKSWRIEIYHEKKLLTQVERTTEEILWNHWSYFLLK
jgi:hypothetical protein